MILGKILGLKILPSKSLAINSPRFEGGSLKVRIEEVCIYQEAHFKQNKYIYVVSKRKVFMNVEIAESFCSPNNCQDFFRWTYSFKKDGLEFIEQLFYIEKPGYLSGFS